MTSKTVLNAEHRQSGARMVPFGGWDMPLHYGSQIEEHHAVRTKAGMFDVSHMVIVDLRSGDIKAMLQHLLANDVAKLGESGKALYSCMLNADGGVIDDLIVYYMDDSWYRMVVNAATRDKDLAWIDQQSAGYEVEIKERADLAMIAVQGPNARERAIEVLPVDVVEAVSGLERFFGCDCGEWFVGRTGYTGEDGFEVFGKGKEIASLWEKFLENSEECKPIGLADGGDMLTHYNRMMSILDKIKTKPGMTVEEILDQFSKFEREEIYPPIYPLNLSLMLGEMATVDYIEVKDDRAYPKNPP